MKYTKYVTKQGDRWDTIAYKAYGIASKFKGIMEANRTVSRAPVLEAGIELLIPVISEAVVKGSKDVPPWKESDTLDNGFESENSEVVEESRINESANPARYRLINSNGRQLTEGVITAGTIGEVKSPDAYISFNGGEPVPVATGETHDITAPPSHVILKDTGGEVLDERDVASGAEGELTAPDAMIEIYDQDDNLIDSGSAKSGSVTPFTVNIPEPIIPNGWYRPIEWLSQPTIADENVVWELMAVFPGNQNPYTHNLQSAGFPVTVRTEFYTDKDAPTPFYTTTTNNNTLIDYDDCDPSTEFRGYRQCWVKLSPFNPANNWGRVDFEMAHSIYGNYSSQILERIISCKTTHTPISNAHRMGFPIANPMLLENVEYRNRMPFVDLSDWLSNALKLKRVYSEEAVMIQGSMNNAFENCALMTPPENITFAPNSTYAMYAYSNMANIVLDFANSSNQVLEFHECKANTIIGLNMASCTQPVGDLTNNNLYYLELHGYTIGHALNGNAMRGEEVFTAWIDSLGNASGSQNITASTLQYNSFGGLGSYVDDEIFNKGYSLIVL